MYVLVTKSHRKSNQRPSMKAAGDFWHEGSGHQPIPRYFTNTQSFNFRSAATFHRGSPLGPSLTWTNSDK